MSRGPLAPGDVLEVGEEGAWGYLLYLGRHVEYGDGVAVVPRLWPERPELGDRLFDDHYATFYPAGRALRAGLAKVIGRVSPRPMPGSWRRHGMRAFNPDAPWIVTEGRKDRLVAQLGENERRYPIASIWNHEMLLHCLAAGWRPTDDV